ncbi:MAG: C40 family peptidase [Cytophagales bacterium]|nr:C40 family peptidase [Armatimonadota bacterium]
MAASGGRRRRLGYSGWFADLIGLLVVIGLALWGTHKWNSAPAHPLGLPDVPVSQRLPAPARQWLSGTILKDSWKAETRPTSPSPPSPATPEAVTPESVTQEPVAETPTVPSTVGSPAPAPAPETPKPSSPAAAEPAPARAAMMPLKTVVRPSADPLSAAATTLHQQGDLLCLGLPDGGIAIRDGKTQRSVVVPLPKANGPVRSIATSPGGGSVWWLAGGNRIYGYDRKRKTLRGIDLPGAIPGAALPDAVAVLPGAGGRETVVVLGGATAAARFFDSATGQIRAASEVLPDDAAEAMGQPATTIFLAGDPTGGTRASLLLVSGAQSAPGQAARVTLWTTSDARKLDAWKRQESDAVTTPAYSTLRLKDSGRAAADLNTSCVALLARPVGGQTLAACQLWTAASADGDTLNLRPLETLPPGVFGLWAAPERVAVGRSGLWWTFGGSVFHTKPAGGAPEVYLPWNLPSGTGGRITALLADDSGAWVASSAGVRRITPALASAKDGYGGYIRARLGEAAGKTPAAPLPQKLARTAQEWEGTPYLWGGNDKKGVDCSGYVAAVYKGLGVALPRSTAELPTCPGGPRIRDELKYGDVLIFPGHCAVYQGNGWTTEAMTDSGVGRATIWTRKQVVVRRFLRS